MLSTNLCRFGGLVALSLLAACGGTPASAPSAQPGAASAPASAAANTELQTIIDGARKEGQLSLVFGEGTMGGTEAINQLAVGFNKAYGLNLKIQFTPGVDMVAMAAKTVEEAQAKKQATSDLYVGYDTQINTISRADALEPVDWANWAPNLIKPGMVAPDGLAVTFESSLPGIVYNSQKFTGDAVPKTLQDLLQPRYKGQLASTPYASSFDRLSTPEVWGKDKTLDFATKYASQLAGLIRCNEMERIASGEFPIFAVSCSQNGGLSARAKGEPVDFEIAADYPMIMYLYLGVPRTSAHPNAAKLWVNYLLSRPAQDILYKYDFQDSHLVDGSQTATLIDKMQSQGVKFYLDNLEFYRSHDEKELQSVVAQVVKIFQSTH